ncbi:GTPase [Leptolyngbya sp. FACHB-16]|uniref:GTP-binding protein n=1 Tax=unclassified Leptolyngbya TaxID=2650499 RepID=UPI0016891B13|nr:GTPase [Leptolyngbya sp. FACHB-16]MBD2156919.1 GTPase [Leptolyngbya sp. FACHB-16]
MEILRIVVTGTVGAGKTSFIRTISEIEVADTEHHANDESAFLKQDTTVAFDFGRLTIGPNQAVHLYGTPGQAQFDFTRDTLIDKAHAYILLVNAHRPQGLHYSRRILSSIHQRVRIPIVIGLTHVDYPDAWTPDTIALALGLSNERRRPPMVCLDATDRESVSKTLITLIEAMMAVPVSQ